MTGRPAALSALAFASTASVADSEMADTRADILVVGMTPWCHLGLSDHQSVSPAAEFGSTWWCVRHTLWWLHPEGSSSIGRVPVSKTGGWGFESLLPCKCGSAGPARSCRTARGGPASALGEDMATQTRGHSAERRSGSGAAKRDRTTPALFIRQVAAELRKVIWPTRNELVTYTVAALVFVVRSEERRVGEGDV